MNKGVFYRIFICVFFLGFCLYSYLNLQNEITQLRICIPELMNKVVQIEEENMQFQYEIKRFENPENLMRYAKLKQYSHLRFPASKKIICMRQTQQLEDTRRNSIADMKKQPTITFATGVSP